MKASAFSYARATSVGNALELLAAHGDGAKVLSGGQSLMPAMNLRLISPEMHRRHRRDRRTPGHRGNGRCPQHRRADAPCRSAAIAGNCRACAAADGSDRPCRASRDPQQGHARRQPRACRSRFRTAGLHAGAGCDHYRSRPGRRAADRGRGFLHRDLRDGAVGAGIAGRRRAAGRAQRIPRISSANSRGGTATTPSSAWRRRRSWKAGPSPIFAWRSLRSATGRYWPGPRRKLINVAVTPAMLSEASAALGEELDPQDDQQASVAMRRHLAKVLLARCVSALLGRPDLDAGGPA